MSFIPYTYKAKVIQVYDGDTFTLDIDLGFYIVKHETTIRLARVNTPELRGAEREDGIKVRDYFRSLILDKHVIIKTYKDKKGKYGRYLAEIIYRDSDNNEINLSDHLLAIGFAKQYE